MRYNTLSAWSVSSLVLATVMAIPMLTILLSLLQPQDAAWEHLRATILPSYVSNTLLLMLMVGVLSAITGVTTAWLTAATQFPGRRLFSWALMLPMAAPAYIVAYIYTDLLEYSGPLQSSFRALTGYGPDDYRWPEIRSLYGAAIVLSLVLYPYVYLLTRAAFAQRSATLFDAARTLGASPTKAFFRIALPTARPAIIAGLALVLMETLADFGVVDYFAVPTFSTGIFRTWFAMGERAAAIKLAALMFIIVLLLVALEKFSRRGSTQSVMARDGGKLRIQLQGWRGVLACIVCMLPIILGCVVPMTVLIYYALTVGDPKLGSDFGDYAINSLSVASITVGITVAASLLLAYTQRMHTNALTKGTTLVATLGYALPGAMLAVGLLSPISQLDRALAGFFEQQFNWHSGLLLTGTVATLIYAYVVRFLTVAYNSTNSGLEQVPPLYDHIARNLGAGPRRLLTAIHIPLLRRSILTAMILVFVDTVRELPATLLLRPFNFETLATRVYRLASDERIAEASTAAIAIFLLGLIPVLLLMRLSKKDGA